jgi:hypothetical protein
MNLVYNINGLKQLAKIMAPYDFFQVDAKSIPSLWKQWKLELVKSDAGFIVCLS